MKGSVKKCPTCIFLQILPQSSWNCSTGFQLDLDQVGLALNVSTVITGRSNVGSVSFWLVHFIAVPMVNGYIGR